MHPEDDIDREEQHAFEPRRLAIFGDGIDGEGDAADSDEFKWVGEDEVHWLPHEERDDDEQRREQERDLYGRADCDAHHETYLVFAGEIDGGHVFCGISDDGEDDDAEEER